MTSTSTSTRCRAQQEGFADMQTIYRPGQWYLIVIPGALVALPPDVHNDLISRLWERLPAEKTLASVMDVLTTAAGGSFVALPPFAAAVVEGSAVRIALRGGVVARASAGADAAYELSGAEVTTWSEHFVSDATRVEITVEETDAAAVLPVQNGIVRAAAASAELESDDDAPITAALGSTPRIDEVESGASAASLAGGSAPALALFGVPSSPHVDGTPDVSATAVAAGVPVSAAAVPASDAAESESEPESESKPEPSGSEGAAEETDESTEPDGAEPEPGEPSAPSETSVPNEPVEPAEPAEPDAPVEPNESVEPAEPAEPVEQIASDEPAADEPAEDEFDVPEETIVSPPASRPVAPESIPSPPAIPDLPAAPRLSPPPLPVGAVVGDTIAGGTFSDETISADSAGEDADSGDNGLDEHTWEPPQRSFAPQSDLDEVEQLFEETLHSDSDGPTSTSAPAPTPAPAPAAASAPAMGDHDGATITTAELGDLRRRQSASDDVATQVLAAVPAGHGRIRVSSGQVVELDRAVIIGRRPRSTRASGDDLPHLVAVDSPQQDISRNHLEIRPDAGTVVVIDMRTTNGSTLLRPGAEPVRLHPGEHTLVLSGDVIDLGDGVTVLFEDIP